MEGNMTCFIMFELSCGLYKCNKSTSRNGRTPLATVVIFTVNEIKIKK
jgi:hypothetical protein